MEYAGSGIAQGKRSSSGSARTKVLMQSTGAEYPVVAKKSGNADGAKGIRCPVLFVEQLS